MNLCSKLGLGTVQWGMAYGIANRSGRPETGEVGRMLRLARESGVMLLDTAHAYGDAESVIGQHREVWNGWRIVTKTLSVQSVDFGDEETVAVSNAFDESIRRLKCSRVFGLLVHHAENLLSPGGDRLWRKLQELKTQALVSKIGVSVYEPEQLGQILDRYPIDLVQVPFNLYDQRFLRTGMLDRLKSSSVEIHVRSAFLQGLLLLSPDHLPEQFSAIQGHHARLYHGCDASGVTPLEGCLRFCLVHPQIDNVIVGCESQNQLGEILRAANGTSTCLPRPESFAVEDDSVINPVRWRR